MSLIKKTVRKIKANQFINASFFSAISSAVKIATTLIIGKIIALKSGAEGIAIFGQMLNFVAIIMVLAGGAINEGITKYTSEYRGAKTNDLKNLLSTSLQYILYSSLIIGIPLIIFSKTIASIILHRPDYYSVFVLFGFTIVFYGLNNFLLSIISGHKDFKKFNLINIFNNIFSLLLTSILIYFFGIYGVLVGVVVNQSVVFVFTLFFLKNEIWLVKDNFINKFNNENSSSFLVLPFLALLTTAITPLVAIFIRGMIIQKTSLIDAGYYEFVSRISTTGIMFFALTVSSYYIPRLSEISNKRELLNEVKTTYKIIIPIITIILISIYLLRFIIIKLLATNDFLQSESLFSYQLIGVFFRIAAQITGFVFLAKARIKTVITLEILLNIVYVTLSLIFIEKWGLVGSVYAFATYNFIYLIIVLLVFYKKFVNVNLPKNRTV
ncbi:MAG: O-antigen translocase [Flavobacterium sp.]|nr:O-antigen translocase [Flavobacterium sp.]